MIKYDLNDGNDPDLHPPDLHHNLSLVINDPIKRCQKSRCLPFEPLFIRARNIEIHRVPKIQSFQNRLYIYTEIIPKSKGIEPTSNPINHYYQTTNNLKFLLKKSKSKCQIKKPHLFNILFNSISTTLYSS